MCFAEHFSKETVAEQCLVHCGKRVTGPGLQKAGKFRGVFTTYIGVFLIQCDPCPKTQLRPQPFCKIRFYSTFGKTSGPLV